MTVALIQTRTPATLEAALAHARAFEGPMALA
jgi:hypothetical protein